MPAPAEFNEADHPRLGNGTFTDRLRRDAQKVIHRAEPATGHQKVLDAIAAAQPSFTLVTVNQGVELDSDQITAYLAGDLGTFMESIDEQYSDERNGTARTFARELAAENEVNFDELDFDEQQEIIDAVIEWDDSDISGQLLVNTGDQLMRANLFHASDLVEANPKLFIDQDEKTTTARIDALASELRKHGLNPDADGVRDALTELVLEGPAMWHEAVDIDVIWSGDIAQGSMGAFSGRPIGSAERTLTFEKPIIAIMDRANGGSWVAQFPSEATVTATVTEKTPAFLDTDESKGWSWTKSTGGVAQSAFRNEPTTAWVDRDREPR